MKEYHLTFDIDWAPDSSILETLNILTTNKKKASFFITHKTDLLQEIIARGHNIGIHPNFLKGSTQGKSKLNIVENLLKLAPNTTLVRTHGLYQSTQLYLELFSNFPQLKFDLSNLTYNHAFIFKTKWEYESASFERINFNWEDDFAFYDNTFDWGTLNNLHRNNILNFHPLHISLNSCSSANYLKYKDAILTGTPIDIAIEISKNHDKGAKTFLVNLINSNYVSIGLPI